MPTPAPPAGGVSAPTGGTPPGEATAQRPLRADSMRTREAIKEHALRVLAERPNASLEDIAHAAGINRSTLHRHFARRENLMDALRSTIVDEIELLHRESREAGGTHAEQLGRIVRRLVHVGAHFSFYLEIWEELSQAGDLRTLGMWAQVIVGAVMEGDVRSDLPMEWIAKFIGGTVLSATSLVHDGVIPVERAADLAADAVLAGLAPTPPA